MSLWDLERFNSPLIVEVAEEKTGLQIVLFVHVDQAKLGGSPFRQREADIEDVRAPVPFSRPNLRASPAWTRASSSRLIVFRRPIDNRS
jgi:hypothetical protein